MKKIFGMVYQIALLLFSFSCVEKNTSENKTQKSEFVSGSNTDTLKFTSGVSVIFQDSKGNYWFGSHKEGVCLFDEKSFRYFTIKEGLSDNQVHSIKEDTKGNIWFGTANGVCRYNGTIIINHTTIDNGYSINQWIKTDNDLWFGAGKKEGIYRFDGVKLNYLAFPKPKTANYENVFAVTSIAEGKNNMLWIGTYAGIIGYNGKQFTIISDDNIGLENRTDKLHIRSVFEDSKGRLWIGNNGIGVLLKENNRTINFSEKHNLIHPTSSRNGNKSLSGTLEHVFAIAEDAEGNIWFGDRDNGAWKYDGNTVTNYTEGLTNNFVFSFYKDNKGVFWVGLADGNVFKFDGKKFIN